MLHAFFALEAEHVPAATKAISGALLLHCVRVCGLSLSLSLCLSVLPASSCNPSIELTTASVPETYPPPPPPPPPPATTTSLQMSLAILFQLPFPHQLCLPTREPHAKRGSSPLFRTCARLLPLEVFYSVTPEHNLHFAVFTIIDPVLALQPPCVP